MSSKFSVGDKVRILDTDKVVEIIELREWYYLCDNGHEYDEYELDWAK